MKTALRLSGFSAERSWRFLMAAGLASRTDDENEYWQRHLSVPSWGSAYERWESLAAGRASWTPDGLCQMGHPYGVLHLWNGMYCHGEPRRGDREGIHKTCRKRMTCNKLWLKPSLKAVVIGFQTRHWTWCLGQHLLWYLAAIGVQVCVSVWMGAWISW